MTKTIIIVVLILVQFVLGTQAQNVGQCLDNLVNSAKAGGNLCPAAEEYIRCVFVAVKVPTSSLSETDLTNLENAMETTLTSNGINCNIDIRAILKKVKEDESNAATRTTQKPTGYDGATTIGDCLNTFTGASIQAGSASCSLVTPYIKCLIKVTGLYKYNPYSSTYSDAYSSMETQIETTFRSIGLFCTFDVKEMSVEVANEQKYSNSVSSTSVSPWLRGYSGAATVEDCVNTFIGASTLSCSMITPYIKCLIKVTGLYKNNPYSSTYSDAYSSFETKTETYLRSFGLFCNFDVKEMSAEVASEQNYKNSESGLHKSVRGMMSLYTVTVAAWICSYFFL